MHLPLRHTHPPGIRLWNYAFSADYKMNNGPEPAKEDLLVVAQSELPWDNFSSADAISQSNMWPSSSSTRQRRPEFSGHVS